MDLELYLCCFQDHLLWALKIKCLQFTFPDGALLPLLLTVDVVLSPLLGYILLFQQIHTKYFKENTYMFVLCLINLFIMSPWLFVA